MLMILLVSNSNCVVVIDESINKLSQDDPALVAYIKDKLLEPPPLVPNKIEEMDLASLGTIDTTDYQALQGQYGQPLILEELFEPLIKADNKTKRFFIEAGAYDGVTGSNTNRLEQNEVWSGLLVEPNPMVYESMRSRHRNAWTLPSCLSTKTHPEIINFDAAGVLGGIINEENEVKPGDAFDFPEDLGRQRLELQCVPLYSVLLALGMYMF